MKLLDSQKHKPNPKYERTENTNPKYEQTQNTKGFRSPRLQGAAYCNLAWYFTVILFYNKS